jgi:CO/xanthine dehydrogenase Mo-binding subunit
VLDATDALRPEAPVLHPDLLSYENLQPNFPSGLPRNVHAYMERKRGDVEAAFASADLIVESTWSSGRVHQAYLEPHACLVWIDDEDRIHVWSSNKGPFTMRAHLADALGVDEQRIVVELVRIGGEFGGKGALMNVPIAYHLAAASGRPVRMVMTYVEEFSAGNPRHGSSIRLKTAVSRDGSIVAHQGTTVFDSGAYGGFKPVPGNVLGGGIKTGGAYRIPNVLLQAFIVYTNNVPGGFFRAPGDPQATFAVESHFDLVAQRLGMDPLDFRRRNALHEGDVSPAGMQWKDVLASDVLEAAIARSRWLQPKRPNVGRGLALINRHVGAGESRTLVRLFEDGRVELVTGAPDAGQGVHTIMQQVAAEILTIPPETIAIRLGSTDEVPLDPGLGASRHTHIAGQSTAQGAHELVGRLKASLAEEMGWSADAILLRDSAFLHGQQRVAFEQAARIAVSANGGPVEILATYSKDHSEQETFIAQVAEVEVDPETGAFQVLHFVTAHDTGTLINPIGAEGQIEGGLVQGLGFATMEELRIVDGQVANASFGDYKIPCIADVPPLEMVLLQDATGPGPWNAKSLGEHSLIPPAAAIANAIYDAVGVRITSTPITAEKVYAALVEKSSSPAIEQPSGAVRRP